MGAKSLLEGDDPISKKYKGKVKIGNQTPLQNIDGSKNYKAYNCHSYAWNNGNGDINDPANLELVKQGYTKWDNDPTNNFSNANELSFDAANQVGDKVVYFDWDVSQNKLVPTHSGVVTAVENGKTIQVTSKWGQAPLYNHHPRDIPISYGNTNPTFIAPNGNTYPSRIYYRTR